MIQLKPYMFTDIPGAGKGWTLVITAVSLQDARDYIKVQHGSGKYVGLHTPSRSDFDSQMCGAITEKAHEVIRGRMQL